MKMTKIGIEKSIRVFTDGACSGNPGCGGYGVVLLEDEKISVNGGNRRHTTNNVMELIAIIEGIRIAISKGYNNICIYSDSAYVINAVMLGWLVRWKNNGWKTVKGDDVKNHNEWVKLDELLQNDNVNVTFVKVKGHSGNHFNEMADQEAKWQSEIAKMRNGKKYV